MASALVVVPAIGGCHCDLPDPELIPCAEQPVPAVPAGDPCRLGTVVLGPVRIDRGRGRPVEERFSFDAPEARVVWSGRF